MLPVEKRNFGSVVPRVEERPFVATQADGLSMLRRRTARVLAVTSGKGGVGKTNLAVNLSIALSRRARRVVLVDLDLGLANVDVLLKIEARYNLSHVIDGRRALADVVVRSDAGIFVVAGASGIEDIANLDDRRRTALIRGFHDLACNADFVVFDTQAGISRNTVEFVAAADDVVVVTTPEPTAVLDAFAMIKLLTRSRERGTLRVVVNMARTPAEAERVMTGVVVTARRLLDATVERMGSVPFDEEVVRSVKRNQPFILGAPYSRATQSVRAMADSFVAPEEGRPNGQSNFVKRLLGVFRRSA